MGAYQVGKLLFEMGRNPRLAKEFRADQETVLGQFQLTTEEKEAFRHKDMRFLYELGVNPYLMRWLQRFLSVTQQDYLTALTDAGPSPACPNVSFPGPAPAGQELIRSRGDRPAW